MSNRLKFPCKNSHFDLDHKKTLRTISEPSESFPFLRIRKWTSDHEVVLYDADGYSVGSDYVYNAETNDLRRVDGEEAERYWE